MADALSKLQPALPPRPPAEPPGAALTSSARPEAPAHEPAADMVPVVWLGGVLLALGVLAGWWWRVRRPARRLRRALRQWQHTWGEKNNPALAAQALQALARRHGYRPGADWQAAVQRIMFAPAAPQAAWGELRQLAAQVPRMERRP